MSKSKKKIKSRLSQPFVDSYAVDNIIKSLSTLAMRDVEFISKVDAVLAAFMVASCLIDQLGGIMNGGKSTGATYRKFISKYLPKYDKHNLYEDLRCALVHNYSIGRNYVLTRDDPGKTIKTPDGKTIIYIIEFVNDLKIGFDAFIKDLHTDQTTREKATSWSRDYKIISHSVIQF